MIVFFIFTSSVAKSNSYSMEKRTRQIAGHFLASQRVPDPFTLVSTQFDKRGRCELLAVLRLGRPQ
jgi:hypothetical protein